jgi:hypothetical protein
MSNSLPRLFVAVSRGRWLLALLALTLVSGAAMLPAMSTMSDHGASLFDFEMAGSVSRSSEILSDWGGAGKNAMWWQLALDIPFMVGYGLFLAGACAAVARRAQERGMRRLRSLASAAAWLGPLAAILDLLQDVGLALVLAGRVEQPWPRVGQVCGVPVTYLAAAALAVAAVGALMTRERRRAGAAAGQSG